MIKNYTKSKIISHIIALRTERHSIRLRPPPAWMANDAHRLAAQKQKALDASRTEDSKSSFIIMKAAN